MRTPRPLPLPQRPVPVSGVLVPGVTRGMLRSRVAAGTLLRLRDGVYLAASAWPDDPAAQHLMMARAEQVANPPAVISHHSAALAWGLPCPPLADWAILPPALTSRRGASQRSRHSMGARHHEAYLPDHHVTQDGEGWTVTTIARTAVDLALDSDLGDGLVVLDAAARLLCAGMVSSPHRSDYANPAVRRLAREQLLDACAGRRRMAVVRAAIELADPRRESPIESLSAAAIFAAGLPMPEFQAPIRTPVGILYPDCLWVEERLIGEADGATKYDDRAAALREKEREQVLRDLGYGIVRWLGKEITFHPEVVVDRIARALGV